jgi:hypothetical protein
MLFVPAPLSATITSTFESDDASKLDQVFVDLRPRF